MQVHRENLRFLGEIAPQNLQLFPLDEIVRTCCVVNESENGSLSVVFSYHDHGLDLSQIDRECCHLGEILIEG